MKRKNLRILIIGPQGSGKSTQSKLLSEYLGVPFIETGQTLRDLAQIDKEEGKAVKEILRRGEMVPDNIAADLVRTRLAQPDCKRGFVMNGYPRNLNQIKVFNPEFDKVFYLEISDGETVERLLKRRREDDSLDLIKKRLADYHSLTKLILNYYQKLGILEKVDGKKSIEQVQEDIRSRVNG